MQKNGKTFYAGIADSYALIGGIIRVADTNIKPLLRVRWVTNFEIQIRCSRLEGSEREK
jgi:hypothetical protein